MKKIKILNNYCLLSSLLFLTACLTPNTGNINSQSLTTASQATVSFAPGPRAAQFIFKQANPAGSFDASPTGGTVPAPGSGQQATRVFNADGSLLASGGPSAASWPQWISSFEIGISGANNTSALNPDCARFAGATENTAICHFDGTATGPTTTCGATAGLYRVSEYDCVQNTPTNGNGGPNDGVYLRVTLNRANLSSTENVLAVLQYSASALNSGPANPTSCFTGGVFTPESCSDMTWRMYIKHTASEVVQPYMLIVPPALGFVNTFTNTGGAGTTAKQFFVPLAGDQNLTVVQISRTHALSLSPTFTTVCGNGGVLPANTSMCVGMILYSITFFRI